MTKNIILLIAFLAIIALSAQKQSINTVQTSKSGLLFDHGGYRGMGYTDSLGTNYNFRFNPITITNDSIIPINVQIAFSKEYDYSKGNSDEKFNVFPLPREWTIDGITDSMYDSIFDKLPNHIDKPFLNITIEPGENFTVAIGTIYQEPAELWSVVPNKLFSQSDGGIFNECDWLIKEDQTSNRHITLSLKLNFVGSCSVIPCGQISYPEH